MAAGCYHGAVGEEGLQIPHGFGMDGKVACVKTQDAIFSLLWSSCIKLLGNFIPESGGLAV